jgi:DNA-directed RNA polymerase
MEKLMKDLFANKFEEGITSKGLHETYFGQDILIDGTDKMVEVAAGILDKDTPLSNQLNETKEVYPEGLRGVCFSAIEFIMSGLAITKESMKNGMLKKRNVRFDTCNRIRRDIFKAENTEEDTKTAMAFFEMGLEALGDYIDVIRDVNTDTNKAVLTYHLKEEVQNDIIDDIIEKRDSGMYALPLTELPKDWEIVKDGKKFMAVGGYHTEGHRFPLIRGGKLDMNKEAFRVDFLASNRKPLEAINAIQRTAFRVNKAVLEEVKKTLDDAPEKPVLLDHVKEERKAIWDFFQTYPTKADRDEAGVELPEPSDELKLYRSESDKYKTVFGKFIGKKLAVGIAEKYAEYDAIYFPHNFDYRGRMYPIPNSLTPQGDDVSKGLLEFSDAEKLTPEGYEALVAYLASVYGHDKEPYVKRVELGYDLLADMDTDYREADEPYVFFQILTSLREMDETMESRCAIAIDGSCNGLQHMAAITRDKKGGSFVNVGGAAPRQDIYMEIAKYSAELLSKDVEEFDGDIWRDMEEAKREKKAEKDEEYEYQPVTDEEVEDHFLRLQTCRDIISGPKARKIAKRPVMINPYGGTYMGYKDYIYGSLQEFYPLVADNYNANLITGAVNRAMKAKLQGGTLYQKWISQTFGQVASTDVTPWYSTPDGFLVNNGSFKLDEKSTALPSIMSGGFRNFKTVKITNEINVRKIQTRAQPNVIHSLDATHLRMTALECVNEGITQLWFIHDSYASTPNNYKRLNDITREQFIKLYSDGENHPANVIVRSLKDCLSEENSDMGFEGFPTFQGEDRLDIETVAENEFFFA